MKTLLLIAAFGCACFLVQEFSPYGYTVRKSELDSTPLSIDGLPDGFVKLSIWNENNTLHSSIGSSEDWEPAKQNTKSVLPDPYSHNWWVPLISKHGVNEGAVIMGWDPSNQTLFVVCRSWKEIDIKFILQGEEVCSFRHVPKELDPVNQWLWRKGGSPERGQIRR